MAAPVPTVPSVKQSFIAAQITILAQPPVPSHAWRAANTASDHPIPPRALDDALSALAHAIQQHCRRVYPPQATRNVADQIASAYARDAERKVGAEGDVDGAVLKELDLSDDVVIEALPPSWPLDREINDYPMEAKRYVEAASRLTRLNEERKTLRQRVERLRRLKGSVDPFRTTDGAGVQENLITRNGPVEVELERMRFLLARVAGRMSELPATSPGSRIIELASMGGARKRAVDEFLADAHVFPS
ncbi:kinetochore complex fta4 of sim4 subunit, or CENP-50 domain-containing protein [Hirsutella rhossiliensis]|uniref:Kinetochore complex fta4 of sim4 subunit, or CENP-50 domain-containing protein n=1 Tax=Hirsutella rhossiliensis TaxID=111463 RepID=A0A9P8N6E0_9HYPO|nr:kinetochore complex fta4 of sim4 subunit, or CENP-50 domain-containing protein [Hirsutella rhossiliensis]KAH0967402.1 kinetochore complex fta4 of sim4 subunit, or CENP-50 domain-containing protein [Hirsutella rhossiliensis]